jgi:hypothetical protein
MLLRDHADVGSRRARRVRGAVVRWCGGAVVRWCGGAVVRWMTCTFTQSRDSCLALADDASSQVDAAWRTFEQGFKV